MSNSSLGLHSIFLKFLSYLRDREQTVDIAGTYSQACNITCGVPQGSILGPLLFLIYINDMKAAVKCKLILYADDSALLVSGKDVVKIEQVLSGELKVVNEWLEVIRLSLHLGKNSIYYCWVQKKRVYKKMISYISHAMVRTLK